MQVKNIECQIAQAQLRRYLTGEEMPNAIVTDLETHLRHCPECMEAAQSLRESLKGVLNGKITGKPIPQVPNAPATKAVVPTKSAVQAPADFLDAPDSDFKPARTPKKSNIRTLMYSGALALVLVLMSTVFRDPTKLFGARASSISTDTPPAVETDTTSTGIDTDTVAQSDNEPVANHSFRGTLVMPDQVTTTTSTSGNTEIPTTSKPLETSGLIVADGKGTTQIKTDPPKQQPKPRPKALPKKKKPATRKGGVGTIKVYPPIK